MTKHTVLRLLGLFSLLGLSGPLWAATLNVSTAGGLQTALNTAVQGDIIVMANGTYAGPFTINSNNGFAGNPITLTAANQHQAIITGVNTCAGSTPAITLSRNWWVLQNFVVQDTQRGIHLATASNNVMRDLLLTNFHTDGITIYDGSTLNLIQRNVIGHADACNTSFEDAGIFIWKSPNNTVQDNIIVATGDNGYQAANPKQGYAININGEATNPAAGGGNVVQGNLVLSTGGKGAQRVIMVTNTLVRDNLLLFNEGGVLDTGDCSDDSTQFINNIAYGNYYAAGHSKGQTFAGDRGHHLWRHNLFWINDFSRIGLSNDIGNSGGAFPTICNQTSLAKVALTLQDNIFYSSVASSGVHFPLRNTSTGQMTNSHHNVFYAPSGGTVVNYAFAGTDIQAQPTFVDAAAGDFTQVAGVGNDAASDGTDIGPVFNQYLKQQWSLNAFAMETISQTGVTSPRAITVDPTHWYQVWFYIPTGSPCATTETFQIEQGTGDAKTLQRNIVTLNNGSWIQTSGTQRWITLGRHRASDGTMNISWSNNACANGIFLRKIPSITEAYSWITAAPPAETPTAVWPLNESGGTTTTADTSGNSLTGTLYEGSTAATQGPTWISGSVNNALRCDGVNDSVRVSDNGLLDITGDLTIAFWLAAPAGVASDEVILTKFEGVDPFNAPYYLGFVNAGTPRFIYSHGLSGAFTDLTFDGYEVPTGSTMHHYAFVRTIAGTPNVKLYVDGGLADTEPYTTQAGASTGILEWCASAAANYAQIDLDELRLYNRALSLGEIENLFAEGGVGGSFTGVSTTHHRFYAIDKPEGARPVSPEDGSADVRVNGSVRMRVGIANETGGTLTQGMPLQCDVDGGTVFHVTSSCVTNPVCITTGKVAHNTDTGRYLTLDAGLTYAGVAPLSGGVMIAGTVPPWPARAFADAETIENEYALRLTGLTAGQQVCCRPLYGDTFTAFDAYTPAAGACLTVTSGKQVHR